MTGGACHERSLRLQRASGPEAARQEARAHLQLSGAEIRRGRVDQIAALRGQERKDGLVQYPSVTETRLSATPLPQ